MQSGISSRRARRAANLSIDTELLSEAKSLKINVSRAAEAGIARAVAEERARLWLQDNQRAIESSNQFVEQRGLPLGRYRQF